MIVFLNFAPFEFMGGAEKLMLDLAHSVNKKQPVLLVDVSPKLSNIYGKLILKRAFDNHFSDHNVEDNLIHISLTYRSFIPFTQKWRTVRDIFRNARLVYARYEVPEIAILLYFGGVDILKKTVAALHLNPYYASPRGIVDSLHNIVYGSSLYKFFLRSAKKIHVLNSRDRELIEHKYKVSHIVQLPPGIDFRKLSSSKLNNSEKTTTVIYVGELSTRKGVDTLIHVIEGIKQKTVFHIVGDGPLREEIVELSRMRRCIYHGYVSTKKLHKLYDASDVLLFPSRAEAFGIVMAEAMAHGLRIIDSFEVRLELPDYIETTVRERSKIKYLAALKKIARELRNGEIDRNRIRQFAHKNFSSSIIHNRFYRELIAI